MGRQFTFFCMPGELNSLIVNAKLCGDLVFVHGSHGKPEIFESCDAPLDVSEDDAISLIFFIFRAEDWSMYIKAAGSRMTYGDASRIGGIEVRRPFFRDSDKLVIGGRMHFPSEWNRPDRTPFVECVFRRIKKKLNRSEAFSYSTFAFQEWNTQMNWRLAH